MKKIWLSLGLLFWLSSGAPAHSAQPNAKNQVVPQMVDPQTPAAETFHQGLIFDFGLGINASFDSTSLLYAGSQYDLGWDFDQSLTARLEFNYFSYNNPDSHALITQIRLIPELKLTLSTNAVKPYGLLGFGLDINNVQTPALGSDINASFSYPDLLVGAGVDTQFFNWLNVFLEAKLNLIWVDASPDTDLSLMGGPRFCF